VLTKLLIIAAILIVALFTIVRVWRADLDLRSLISPARAVRTSVDDKLSWLPTRDRNALYQGGNLAARVSGVRVDETNKRIEFEEIYESNPLDLGAEFEFQKWRLHFDSADTVTMLNALAPQKGRTLAK